MNVYIPDLLLDLLDHGCCCVLSTINKQSNMLTKTKRFDPIELANYMIRILEENYIHGSDEESNKICISSGSYWYLISYYLQANIACVSSRYLLEKKIIVDNDPFEKIIDEMHMLTIDDELYCIYSFRDDVWNLNMNGTERSAANLSRDRMVDLLARAFRWNMSSISYIRDY